MKITKETLKKVVQFILNPRFLLCFGLAWMITNGWSYVLFAVGTLLGIHWMIVVSSAYLAFLWLPISPEKIVTIALSIFFLRRFFPHDEKTLAILREWHAKIRKKKKEHDEKKAEKKTSESVVEGQGDAPDREE